MTRALIAGLAALAFAGAARAQDMSQAHHAHTFTMTRFELAKTVAGDGDERPVTLDADAWIGGDDNKLWFKLDAEGEDGDLEHAAVEALWSRRVSTFFDLQVGLRQEVEPESVTALAAGFQGLAPYQFETEAFAYLEEDGALAARFEQSIELHLSQRLILEPEVELHARSEAAPARELGEGLTGVGASLGLRYEITRKFAPYVAVSWERALGDTADLVRSEGGDPEETTLSVGLRAWF